MTMRGGIVRVRPDGTDLEIFVTGLRNPFDIGMDPFMNLFTRDNDDNRSGGWDIRVSHLIQSAYYGYSQHYANFPDEIMPPLGQFGGGSGTGTSLSARRTLAGEVSQRAAHRRLGPQ